jgi:GMP synthase (glutamine-hydrolysing)
MGGPLGVYEQDRFPFLGQELRLIERALADGAPLLGVCLGSQLIAAALGASVRKGPRKEIGWHRVYLEPAAASDRLFRGALAEFDAFHWHGDMYDPPPGAVPLARSGVTACQAFRHAEKTYGILFHLEVTGGTVACMTEAFRDELQEEKIDAAELAKESEAKLPGIRSLGASVFGSWVELLTASGQAAHKLGR